MTISNQMTVIGLTNGMIGGIILVMPLLALKSGWLLIAPITIISGFFSYFTCLLCIRHLRDYKNLDVAIYYHFGKKKLYKILYDVIIIISMTTLLILYFSLICEQWAGIVGQSKVIPIVNALALFPIVYIMKKFDFGASLLAYGILSIVGYVIFLIWLWITTEPGPKSVVATHSSFVDLAAALAQGFAIQTFFIPILKKNPNRKLYKKLLGLTYILGTCVYCFIGYSGAFSLINREPVGTPETIQDYFGSGSTWEVILVEVIYLVHLYSAFPEFLLIAKQRFFSIFHWPQPSNVSFKEVIYVAVTILIGLLVKLTQISVTVIIELNGSIISFFFIYVIPIGLHLKCVYYTKPEQRHAMLNEEKEKDSDDGQNQGEGEDRQKSQQYKDQHIKESIGTHSSDGNRQNRQKEIQMRQMDNKESQIGQPSEKEQNKDSLKIIEKKLSEKDMNSQSGGCTECDIKFSSKFQEYGQLFAMGVMVTVGLLIMGYTLFLLISGEQQ